MNNSNNIPAGIVDENIEFFINNDRAMAIYKGNIISVGALPADKLEHIVNKMNSDNVVVDALIKMGKHTTAERVDQFIKCRYGNFDSSADLVEEDMKEPEYHDCGLRGVCSHEGKLCRAIKVKNGHLTAREIQIIILTAQGLLDKEIAVKLGISENTVPVFKRRIQEKTELRSKVDFAGFAHQHNLISYA